MGFFWLEFSFVLREDRPSVLFCAVALLQYGAIGDST